MLAFLAFMALRLKSLQSAEFLCQNGPQAKISIPAHSDQLSMPTGKAESNQSLISESNHKQHQLWKNKTKFWKTILDWTEENKNFPN